MTKVSKNNRRTHRVVLPRDARDANCAAENPRENCGFANNNPTAKIGMTTEYAVKLTRLFDFDGEFKLKVVLPPDAKDVTIEEAVIPPGKDEVKLLLKIAPDALPGNRNNLTLVATALFNNNVPVTQEAKFNVNVVK